MKEKEILEEIKNIEWYIKNTSPTEDEMSFFENQINELLELLSTIKNTYI